MSLYNQVADTLSSGFDLNGTVRSGIGGIGKAAAQALGGGRLATTVARMGASAAQTAAQSAIRRAISPAALRALNVGGGMVGDLMSGDWEGAAVRLLGSGLAGSLAAQAAFMGMATPLFGGISPQEAQTIIDELQSQPMSKKNLFLIEAASSPLGDMADRFNLFATELEYSPWTLSGEKRRVSGATIDVVTGAEPVELRVTTLDDEMGTLRRWFAHHLAAVVRQDGTFGVPMEYAIKIKIVHGFITPASNRGGYEDIGLFRPVNLDVNLSRRESAPLEIQMTFTQLDSFFTP